MGGNDAVPDDGHSSWGSARRTKLGRRVAIEFLLVTFSTARGPRRQMMYGEDIDASWKKADACISR